MTVQLRHWHELERRVSVTIDGFEITVPKGTLIIRAAEQLGIQIPRFCDHPLLAPVGACRQCLVQVEGQPKPPASCTTVCTDGMVVRTQLTSPVAEKAQRGVMEMLLVNHPLDCPMCDKGGECPLQNQAMSTGPGRDQVRRGRSGTFAKPIALSAQVLLDRERCIQCARCTRFADQIAGDPLIDLIERGPAGAGRASPTASRSTPTSPATPCRSARSARSPARPTGSGPGRSTWSRRPSVCEHCAAGCRQRTDHRRGAVTRRLAGSEPGGERGVELRQGPLGVHLRDPARPAGLAAGQGRRRGAAAGLLARGAGRRGARALPRRAAGPACSPAAAHPRGRLRATPSSPGSPWPPTTSTCARRPHSRRGGSSSWPHVAGRGMTTAATRTWSRLPPCCWRASSRRTSPRSCSCGCARRSGQRGLAVYSLAALASPGLARLSRHAAAHACPAARPRCSASSRPAGLAA